MRKPKNVYYGYSSKLKMMLLTIENIIEKDGINLWGNIYAFLVANNFKPSTLRYDKLNYMRRLSNLESDILIKMNWFINCIYHYSKNREYDRLNELMLHIRWVTNTRKTYSERGVIC